jgi:hypothetical protein
MRTLLVVIALMGLVDLGLTWALMTGGGMYEANPLVVTIVGASRSSSALIGFKVSLTSLGCAALWKCRCCPAARLGALLCAAVYMAVVGLWVAYIHTAGTLSSLPQNDRSVVAISR